MQHGKNNVRGNVRKKTNEMKMIWYDMTKEIKRGDAGGVYRVLQVIYEVAKSKSPVG